MEGIQDVKKGIKFVHPASNNILHFGQFKKKNSNPYT